MDVDQSPVKLAIIGVGKIARDQHVPAISANAGFNLCATVEPGGEGVGDVPNFASLDALLGSGVAVDAVAVCTPARVRHGIAAAAITAGLHVMLEKPPAATLSEVDDLVTRAAAASVTLFASWHSREAGGVAPARDWLAGKTLRRVSMSWKEDIRHWHPGQEWILGPGGFGVFDPAINGLSILTAVLPGPFLVDKAMLATPEGRASPLQATTELRAGGIPVTAEFDFLQTGPQSWDIRFETDEGSLTLGAGGSRLQIDDAPPQIYPDQEYPRLYQRFRDLVSRGEPDVDVMPQQIVADIFLVADRKTIAAFEF